MYTIPYAILIRINRIENPVFMIMLPIYTEIPNILAISSRVEQRCENLLNEDIFHRCKRCSSIKMFRFYIKIGMLTKKNK